MLFAAWVAPPLASTHGITHRVKGISLASAGYIAERKWFFKR
jgi:hypothetical protein